MQIQAVYDKNVYYRKLKDIVFIDPREMNTGDDMFEKAGALVPMIDGSICGSLKEEKKIIVGYYTGSKSYALEAFDDDYGGQLKEICKMKGIQARHRQMVHYREMFAALNLLTCEHGEIDFR